MRWKKLVNDLEGGAGALACGSGMAALHMAINAALIDRRRVVLAAKLLYGATLGMLTKVFEPAGVEVVFADFDDPDAVGSAIAEHRPGAIVMETIANPLLRVPALDRIAKMARAARVPLIVDNTFATPLLVRPLEFGAAMSVHSLTKYLSGHGDVMGGIVVADAEHLAPLRTLARTVGFTAGAVRVVPGDARRQDFPAAHGTALRKRLQSGVVAGVASGSGAGQFSLATRSIPMRTISGVCLRPVCMAGWSVSKSRAPTATVFSSS